MFCPACKHAMIVVERHRIELDYCPNCRGVWFDSGELDLWLKSSGYEDGGHFLKEVLGAPQPAAAEKPRRCPICRREMKKAGVSRQPDVLIDACPSEDGLWFDGGEVDILLKELAAKSPEQSGTRPPIAAFLTEVFQGTEAADRRQEEST